MNRNQFIQEKYRDIVNLIRYKVQRSSYSYLKNRCDEIASFAIEAFEEFDPSKIDEKHLLDFIASRSIWRFIDRERIFLQGKKKQVRKIINKRKRLFFIKHGFWPSEKELIYELKKKKIKKPTTFYRRSIVGGLDINYIDPRDRSKRFWITLVSKEDNNKVEWEDLKQSLVSNNIIANDIINNNLIPKAQNDPYLNFTDIAKRNKISNTRVCQILKKQVRELIESKL
jgi:hypothetical protein